MASTLQQQGREHYKRKDYKKALELFDRAYARGDPNVQLLDYRAACYDKLENLPAALKDAKATIKLNSEDPTGYLRAGKILVRSNKRSTALGIYALGLRSVRHIGQGYEALQKVHDVLKEEVAPSRNLDPFSVLPRELALAILEMLTFRERIMITRTSQQWKQFIRSEPTLWEHLDLGGSRRRPVQTRFISTAINVARDRLTAATIDKVYDLDKVLAALSRHCPLASLDLRTTSIFSRDMMHSVLSMKHLRRLTLEQQHGMSGDTLDQLLRGISGQLDHLKVIAHDPLNLNYIEIEKMQLFSLTMPNLSRTSALNATEYFGAAKRMHTLEFKILDPYVGFGTVSFAECTSLRNLWLKYAIPGILTLDFPPTLRSLRLHSSTLRPSSFFSQPGNLQYYFALPELEDLDLDCHDLSLDALLPTLAPPPVILPPPTFNPAESSASIQPRVIRLKRLALTRLSFFAGDLPPAASLGRIEAQLAALDLSDVRELSLEACFNLDNYYLRALTGRMPRLERLSVRSAPISGYGVKEAIVGGSLKELVLVACPSIDRDVVELAKERKVRVTWMATAEGGGRKVRY